MSSQLRLSLGWARWWGLARAQPGKLRQYRADGLTPEKALYTAECFLGSNGRLTVWQTRQLGGFGCGLGNASIGIQLEYVSHALGPLVVIKSL